MKFEILWGDTIWWDNDWKPGHRFRFRKDYLVGFHRVYSRELRFYIYALIIYKLKIRIWREP